MSSGEITGGSWEEVEVALQKEDAMSAFNAIPAENLISKGEPGPREEYEINPDRAELRAVRQSAAEAGREDIVTLVTQLMEKTEEK